MILCEKLHMDKNATITNYLKRTHFIYTFAKDIKPPNVLKNHL